LINPSATIALTVLAPADQLASFDPALMAPRCSSAGRSCDTGSLVTGRASSEPNAPNTILRSCLDGTGSGAGSITRIRVASASGANLTAGGDAAVLVTLPSMMYVDDAVDFFFAADAASPRWTLFATAAPGSGAPGSTTTTVGASYRLPAGALQAVRAQYRRGGSAVPCVAGTLNDRDDLVFAVQ
jgi:leucyl aminopeptidase